MGKQVYENIELIELYSEYVELVGGNFVIETNDRQISHVDIVFHEENFPHLIGVHKMASLKRYVKSSRAKDIIAAIKDGSLTMQHVTSDLNFNEIRSRIDAFYFMLHTFLTLDTSPVFIQIKDMNPRRLDNVEFILYRLINNNKKMQVAGFSRTKKGWFSPATLHERKFPNVFTGVRQAQVIKFTSS